MTESCSQHSMRQAEGSEAEAQHRIGAAGWGRGDGAGKKDNICGCREVSKLWTNSGLLGRFKTLGTGIKSVHGQRFLRRLGAAARSGWACLFVGLILEYAAPVTNWMAIPYFAVVICLNIVESSVGVILWNVVGVLIGMAQAMSIGVVVLSVLGPKLSLTPTIVCIFVASFFVSYPLNSHEMTRKVALAQIGIIFTTAHSGQNDQNLFFLVRLMATTLIGAFCAVLAVLVPIPGLAYWEACGSAKSAIRASTELFQSLVEAFCSREASTFSSIFLHSKFLAQLATTDICELNRRKVHAMLELRWFGLIPTFKRMVKGLNGLQLHLLGMNLALQSGTILLAPSVMIAVLKYPFMGIGEKSKSILDLTTNLSISKEVLLKKQKVLEEAKAEFKLLDEMIMVAREETYYKQQAEEQSLDELLAHPNPHGYNANENIKQSLRTMVPTYFFLFNLRMFFMETMNMIDSGKITNKMHHIATADGHQIRTLDQTMVQKRPAPPPAPHKHDDAHATASDTGCGASTCGCQYEEPRSTRWQSLLRRLAKCGMKFDRSQIARAFKVSLAMSMAALAGITFNTQYAFWATICLGFIVQQHQGGSFRMGSLRLQGTVIGGIYGYLAVLVTHDYPYLVLIALIPWVVVMSYLRDSRIFGPAGLIAGLTAGIVMLGQKGHPIQDFALIRITENFIGVFCLVVVESVVWPNRAVTLSRRNLVSGVVGLRDCVANVIAAYTGDYCPKHRRTVVQEIKKLEQELRARSAKQANLQSEAIMEPDLWNVPFPAEIYSKLAHIQGRMLDLLYFMVSSLHAATEDCLREQIEKLTGPLQTSLVALEDEVLSSLDLLQSVLQVKRHKIVLLSKSLSLEGDVENQPGRSIATSVGNLRKMVAHVHPLLVLECRQRAIDGTPLSMQSTMEAFEASYEEVVCRFIAAKRENPAESLLSNSAMLSFSAVAFSLKLLLRETVELEKAVHELLHFENPWSMLDFWETFPQAFKGKGNP